MSFKTSHMSEIEASEDEGGIPKVGSGFAWVVRRSALEGPYKYQLGLLVKDAGNTGFSP